MFRSCHTFLRKCSKKLPEIAKDYESIHISQFRWKVFKNLVGKQHLPVQHNLGKHKKNWKFHCCSEGIVFVYNSSRSRNRKTKMISRRWNPRKIKTSHWTRITNGLEIPLSTNTSFGNFKLGSARPSVKLTNHQWKRDSHLTQWLKHPPFNPVSFAMTSRLWCERSKSWEARIQQRIFLDIGDVSYGIRGFHSAPQPFSFANVAPRKATEERIRPACRRKQHIWTALQGF